MKAGRILILAAFVLLLVVVVMNGNRGAAHSPAASVLVRRPVALPTAASGSIAPNSLVTSATLVTPAAASEALAPKLVRHPLPKCSVVFFHHLEKTGGTTLRSILQRHAQLGEFDFVSFVNRFDKLQLQMVLHRLHTLLDQPDGLKNLRLAIER